MTRAKAVFLSTVILVLSAGVVVGRLSAWWAPIAPQPPQIAVPPPRPPGPPPFVPWARFEELNLTPNQKQQMDAIWADTRQQMHKLDQQHDALRQSRIAAVYKLLSPQQRTAYDQIDSEFRAKGQSLESARQNLFHDANQKSLALLDATQRQRWESMTRAGREGGRERHGPFGPGTRRSARSTTRPAAGAGDTAKGGA